MTLGTTCRLKTGLCFGHCRREAETQILTTHQAIAAESVKSLSVPLTVVCERFYDRLFELKPELLQLFRSSPQIQSRKLATTLGLLLANKSGDALESELQKLGAAHKLLGVTR